MTSPNASQQERRRQPRLPVMRNVGEPIDLQVIRDHRKTSIPGFILNLSAGGLRIVTLGDQAAELTIGTPFILDVHIAPKYQYLVEGRIVSMQKSDKAKLHHSDGEWFLGLEFTKIKDSDAKELNRLAEDWNICETKIKMNLPDICYKECSCFPFCEKTVKLVS